MTDPRGYVRPGQKLALAAAQVNWINEQMRRRDDGEAAGASQKSPYVWALARNNTAAAVARWAVLGINGMDVVPTDTDSDATTVQFQAMPVLSAIDPDDCGARICVAIEPIKAGSIGRVAVAGTVQIRAADLPKAAGACVLWKDAHWALVRLGASGTIRVGKTASAWDVNTAASIDVWELGVGPVPSQNDPAETIDGVVNLSHNVASGVFVVIGQAPNGSWYLLEAGNDGECQKTIAGEDVTRWPGWDATKEQILGHDASGCIKWFDTTSCA